MTLIILPVNRDFHHKQSNHKAGESVMSGQSVAAQSGGWVSNDN